MSECTSSGIQRPIKFFLLQTVEFFILVRFSLERKNELNSGSLWLAPGRMVKRWLTGLAPELFLLSTYTLHLFLIFLPAQLANESHYLF